MPVKGYKSRTQSGADRRVRELLKQIDEAETIMCRLAADRIALAKLAATGPAFMNAMDAVEAVILRDNVLKNINLHPDGTPIHRVK